MTVADYIKKNKANCCGCYACKNTCPVEAITFEYDDEGFWYPQIDEEVCVQCERCVKVCPCVNKLKVLPVKGTYACYAKDQQELMTSSSGGIFAVLAREALKKGGYVFGAAFDESFSVVHKVIQSEDQLNELKGTKYVQSKIGTVYSQIKALLDQNQFVMFSGTPCQVAGLKTYLNREYDNLITVDLICHGVPSPRIWQEYLDEISEYKKLTGVCFRNKEKGISAATMDFAFNDGSLLQTSVSENPYYKGFVNNYYLRPSCFECKFKGLKRCSDLTIGDFWAVKEYYPDFDSKFGTSAVIIRTEKADKLLESSKNRLKTITVEIKYLSVWNECLLKPINHTNMRKVFYQKRRITVFSKLIDELSLSETLPKRKESVFKKIKKRLLK